jgi:hypothetical protein
MGEGRGVYRVLVGDPLGRPRNGWEDNSKMDLREIGIDGANWIQLQVFVNTAMKLRAP